MNGVYNPASGGGGGGGSSVDNTSPLFKEAQWVVADNLEIAAGGSVMISGAIPIVEGYKAVAIPQYAIWDGTSGGYGYGYAFIGNQYIDHATGRVYLLIHNRSAASAIKVEVIVFILYMRNGTVSTPETKLVSLNYGLGSARVTTCGKLCTVTVDSKLASDITVSSWAVLGTVPKPTQMVYGANAADYNPSPYLNITTDGTLRMSGSMQKDQYIQATLTYITA